MIELHVKVFLFLKDYVNTGNDRYFIDTENGLEETSAREIVLQQSVLICHDYWLIAPSLLEATGSLPARIIDLDELHIATSGSGAIRKQRDKKDIGRRLAHAEIDQLVVKNYFSIFNRSSAFDISTYKLIVPVLTRYWKILEKAAKNNDEFERFCAIEMPVSHYLVRSAATGIAINIEKLLTHKRFLERDFYMALKTFSARYNLSLEVPNDDDIIEYLEPRGFDFSGVDVDYVLQFVPMQDDFATDVLNLRKLAKSRKILSALTSSKRRTFPFVDSFGSITSRIYYRDPALQNLAKRHRDVLEPDKGSLFSYLDYGQYEAGIMAALSGDRKLLELYAQPDMYEALAISIFDDASKRKLAKRLFLSYAYGMRKQGLLNAAFGFGADRSRAKEVFGRFVRFEEWKLEIWARFLQEGKIGTGFGNYLIREKDGALSDAEKRSSISQVVQGTASLIFKKALLVLSRESDVQLRLPMHDAVLIQHSYRYDVERLKHLFADVMTNHFGGLIIGKVSRDIFFKQVDESK